MVRIGGKTVGLRLIEGFADGMNLEVLRRLLDGDLLVVGSGQKQSAEDIGGKEQCDFDGQA